MKDLNFPVGHLDNFGGVDRFWFTPEASVKDVDENGMVILHDDAVWYIGKATKYSLDFSSPAKERRGGTLYEPRLTGLISRWTPELGEVLKTMSGNRYILIYKDKNGYLNQVGTIEQGLTFEFTNATGDTPSSKNGVRFTFSGTVRQDTLFFNREIVTGTPGGGNIPNAPHVTIKINGTIVALMPPGSTYEISSDFTLEYLLQEK